jgi:hypothetical protein
MHSTLGLMLMFGGGFLIYEALAPSAHKITTAGPPKKSDAAVNTPGGRGESGLDPGVGAGSGGAGGGGGSW